MDINKSLKILAEHLVPNNITYDEIQKAKSFRQVLHIRIYNNEIYVLNGLKGEPRHADIIEQLFNVIDDGYVLPNVEFKYYTMDTVIMKDVGHNSAIFSWICRVDNDVPRRILVPSFAFNGYNSGKFMDKSDKVKYDMEMKKIIDFSEKNEMPFEKKENVIIFKGQVDLYPHRILITNELKDKVGRVSEFLLHERGRFVSSDGNTQYQNPMEFLSKYRYQLVMNGASRSGKRTDDVAGTIRPKYLLATGSLLLYITNDNIRYKEWWMHPSYFDDTIVYCKNVNEALDKIDYFEKNVNIANELSKKGLEFVKNKLTYTCVKKFWFYLLQTYAERCTFKITEPKGTLMNNRETVYKYLQLEV